MVFRVSCGCVSLTLYGNHDSLAYLELPLECPSLKESGSPISDYIVSEKVL